MTTSKTTPKTAKKATVSPKGRPSAKGTKNAKPGVKHAHTATPTHTSPAKAIGTTTLVELADNYLKHLEEIGKSPATVFSYRMDLAIARQHFGDATPATSLTPEKVAAFFECDSVVKRKNGQPKTEVTIKKTRRVLRLALVWAAEQKLIEEAPIPAAKS